MHDLPNNEPKNEDEAGRRHENGGVSFFRNKKSPAQSGYNPNAFPTISLEKVPRAIFWSRNRGWRWATKNLYRQLIKQHGSPAVQNRLEESRNEWAVAKQ